MSRRPALLHRGEGLMGDIGFWLVPDTLPDGIAPRAGQVTVEVGRRRLARQVGVVGLLVGHPHIRLGPPVVGFQFTDASSICNFDMFVD